MYRKPDTRVIYSVYKEKVIDPTRDEGILKLQILSAEHIPVSRDLPTERIIYARSGGGTMRRKRNVR